MTRADKLPPKLRKSGQPPLSHTRAIPDSDRARRPPLDRPSVPHPELTPVIASRVWAISENQLPSSAPWSSPMKTMPS
jgi:hypothetical protein